MWRQISNYKGTSSEKCVEVLDHVLLYEYLIILTLLQEELKAGEEVATCPSCSLIVKVIYDPVSSCRHAQWALL